MKPPAHASTWPLHEAKNRLSAVVDAACEVGPQTITRHGVAVAVVVPVVSKIDAAGISAWDLLRDDLIASLGGPPEIPARTTDAVTEVPLPW